MQNLNFRRTELSFFSQLFLIVLALLNNGKTWKKTETNNDFVPLLYKYWLNMLLKSLFSFSDYGQVHQFLYFICIYIYALSNLLLRGTFPRESINMYAEFVCVCYGMLRKDSEGLFIWTL